MAESTETLSVLDTESLLPEQANSPTNWTENSRTDAIGNTFLLDLLNKLSFSLKNRSIFLNRNFVLRSRWKEIGVATSDGIAHLSFDQPFNEDVYWFNSSNIIEINENQELHPEYKSSISQNTFEEPELMILTSNEDYFLVDSIVEPNSASFDEPSEFWDSFEHSLETETDESQTFSKSLPFFPNRLFFCSITFPLCPRSSTGNTMV
ncbi:hypothetical protein PN498_11695 [Oscillatoria sp. CS-180]|uniref:hypothetical protein n=1 Tax=Oscillatoria sp. CS-180 TaxID=3021720 RepID=UPI00232DD1D6|nr:hypothetical protein [Oscillatoria sp. CS-180]MDB9526656.1 hypothetical protein [Oscillatoria sp. CS-180]